MWKIALLSLMLVGCATHAKLTSGLIGCSPDEVEISDLNRGFIVGSWTAKCKGRTFYCTGTVVDGGMHGDCKEALK